MTAFTDYLTPETIGSIRAKMKGYAGAALLAITDWLPGGVGQQILEAVDQALLNTANINSALVRGYASLDTSTDPGDVDPYDPANVTLPPTPGMLSEKGRGDYGTPRIDRTFARGTMTITNGNAGAIIFAPERVTFTRNTNFAGQTYAPTYVNAPDPAIYTNPDGTVTVSAGATLDIPIIADEIGTASNATAGTLSIVTVIASGVTATNAASVLGTERQSAEDYRAACREQASLTSPNGAADAYRYLAVTARDDGTYGDSTTGTPLGVTRVYVNASSATGIATVYIAGAAGGAAVSSALATVTALIKVSPGVIAVPTAMTINIALATDTTIAVTYSVKIKAANIPGGAIAATYTSSGGPPANVAAVFTAIAASLNAYVAAVDIGGVDQTAGAGVIYTVDLLDAVASTTMSGVAIGLYNPAITTPAGSSTAITLGHVGILGTVSGTLVAT